MPVKKLIAFLAAFLMLPGPIEGRMLPAQTPRPAWITVLPERSGRVYAVGLAAFAPGEAQAIQQAQAHARVEVLTRLRASVKGETSIQSSMTYTQPAGAAGTGSASKTISQDARILTQASELPGLTVEATWSDLDGRTAYALAYLDVPVAERELRLRFGTLQQNRSTASSDPAGSKERLALLQRRKERLRESALLDDMASLLSAGGGDPALRSDIHLLRLAEEKQLEALRGTIIFSLKADRTFGVSDDIKALIRNAVLREGLGWSELDGEFVIQIRYSGNLQSWDISRQQWWEFQPSSGFTIARGTIELVLLDRTGTEYESATLAAKGVGVDDTTATRALLKEYRIRLETTVGQWLQTLAR